MDWQVKHKRAFLKELTRLPQAVREEAEAVAFGDAIRLDPFLNGRVEKMAGYRAFYKIRLGSYRIGLKIDQSERIIEFQRALHRKDIYRVFP